MATRTRKKAGKGEKRVVGREGGKAAKVLALLERPEGASLKELVAATGWQAHSVRGFISGSLKKKMGLKVESYKCEDRDRAYRSNPN